MLKIWEEKESAPEYFIKTEIDTEGDMAIFVVDKAGNKVRNGNLLWIKQNGKMELAHSINQDIAKELGLSLNALGQLEIEDY